MARRLHLPSTMPARMLPLALVALLAGCDASPRERCAQLEAEGLVTRCEPASPRGGSGDGARAFLARGGNQIVVLRFDDANDFDRVLALTDRAMASDTYYDRRRRVLVDVFPRSADREAAAVAHRFLK